MTYNIIMLFMFCLVYLCPTWLSKKLVIRGWGDSLPLPASTRVDLTLKSSNSVTRSTLSLWALGSPPSLCLYYPHPASLAMKAFLSQAQAWDRVSLGAFESHACPQTTCCLQREWQSLDHVGSLLSAWEGSWREAPPSHPFREWRSSSLLGNQGVFLRRGKTGCPFPLRQGAKVLSAKPFLAKFLEPHKHSSIFTLTVFYGNDLLMCLACWLHSELSRTGMASGSRSVLSQALNRCPKISLGSSSCLCSQLPVHTFLAQSLQMCTAFTSVAQHTPFLWVQSCESCHLQDSKLNVPQVAQTSPVGNWTCCLHPILLLHCSLCQW